MSYKIYKVSHNFGATIAYTYEVRSANRPAPLNAKAVRWNIKSHETAKKSINKIVNNMIADNACWEFVYKSRPLGEPEPITEVYYAESQADYEAIRRFRIRTCMAPVLKGDDVPDESRKRGVMSMEFCKLVKLGTVIDRMVEKAIA